MRDWDFLCEKFIKKMAIQILVLRLHERISKKRIVFVYDASDNDPDDMGMGEASSLWHDSLVKLPKLRKARVQCSRCCQVGGVRNSLRRFQRECLLLEAVWM